MTYRTAIITRPSLPEDTSDVTDEEGLVEVWVELGRAYAVLRRVDVHTAVNASTLDGPIEDHIDSFTRV